MADMDVDMDLDFAVEDVPIEESHADSYNAPTFEKVEEPTTAPAAVVNPFDGSITSAAAADIAFEKVHFRGLDDLDNGQLKAYIRTYYDSPSFVRIEWIDDASANFVYSSTSAAAEALKAFTDTDICDPAQLDELQIRPAKKLVKEDGQLHDLQIRQATSSDVKRKGAHVASKFYLMNPDKDPRERHGRERGSRSRDVMDSGDYRRNRYDDREHKRRREVETFDENMYDDDAGVRSADEHSDRRKRVRFGGRGDDDLFAGRGNGRLRNRSASPRGDGDGRYGFEADPDIDESNIRRRIRQRSQTPPRMRPNAGRELFPSRDTQRKPALAPAAPIKELFAQKLSTTPLSVDTSSKELFPNKTRVSNHRRSAAIDASPDRYSANPLERPRSLADRISGPLSLANRITGPSSGDRVTRLESNEGQHVRGSSNMSIKGAGNTISIKGAAAGTNDFSIKGASGAEKELFPVKANAGKELFSEKLKGRGVTRRTAASYF